MLLLDWLLHVNTMLMSLTFDLAAAACMCSLLVDSLAAWPCHNTSGWAQAGALPVQQCVTH